MYSLFGFLFSIEQIHWSSKNRCRYFSNGKRDIDLSFHFTLLPSHYKCCLYRSLVKKVGRHWLVQSIGRNESNVDSNDINWRARVGTKISHAMRDLNRTMFSRYRFVRLTFIILSGRRSRIQVACRLKRKRNSRRINYFPRHFCPSANRHCYHGR